MRVHLVLIPNGHAMARKMLRAGHYWLTMESDYCKYVKKCHKCQIYADKIHIPPDTSECDLITMAFLHVGN